MHDPDRRRSRSGALAAPLPARLAALGTACLCTALAGCSTMHVKRATYQVLRQEDCRLNRLESFCLRNFSNEYHEYERLRRTFMRETSEATWRVSAASTRTAGARSGRAPREPVDDAAARDAAVRAALSGTATASGPALGIAPALRSLGGTDVAGRLPDPGPDAARSVR